MKKSNFQKLLREYLKEKGMAQHLFGKKVGTYTRNVERWISGVEPNPNHMAGNKALKIINDWQNKKMQNHE